MKKYKFNLLHIFFETKLGLSLWVTFLTFILCFFGVYLSLFSDFQNEGLVTSYYRPTFVLASYLGCLISPYVFYMLRKRLIDNGIYVGKSELKYVYFLETKVFTEECVIRLAPREDGVDVVIEDDFQSVVVSNDLFGLRTQDEVQSLVDEWQALMRA